MFTTTEKTKLVLCFKSHPRRLKFLLYKHTHRCTKTHNTPPVLLYNHLFPNSLSPSLPSPPSPFTQCFPPPLVPFNICYRPVYYVGGGPKETTYHTHTHTHIHSDAHCEGGNPTFCEPCGSHCCVICCNCVVFERELVYITYFITTCVCVCVCVSFRDCQSSSSRLLSSNQGHLQVRILSGATFQLLPATAVNKPQPGDFAAPFPW